MEKVIELIKDNTNTKIWEDVSLKRLTNYKVGGVAKYVIRPRSIDDLVQVIKYLKKSKSKFIVLGKGTNVLFSDKDYDGIIVKLDYLNKVEIIGTTLEAEAGASLVGASIKSIKASLAGLEFAEGIPGTVGGAVYMNAGAYNSDMGYVVSKVMVLTPDFKVINMVNKECMFKYRTSFFKQNKGYIILKATIKLRKSDRTLLEEIVSDRRKRRIKSQPLEYPSAGSVYRNHSVDMPTGKLVEELGLKGLYSGGAQISKKHGNFIINKNNAKAKDIKKLMDIIKETVKENYDIDLHLEQELINWE